MKRMKGPLFLSFFLIGLFFFSRAQVSNDAVLMTIDGQNVTVGEFLTIYNKNKGKTETMDKQSLDEYLDLFVNFKLKVKEAEDLGLDTITSFKTELNGYREQLAKPYFIDEATLDRLVNEAFERSQQDVRASHIFVRVAPDALPVDTMAGYQKIIQIRERLITGEKFENLAMELSEDPSARDREASAQRPAMKGNKGDLGYFTVFDMVYPFETGAYTTPVGNISEPVRTEYGYHLIKVAKKQPAMGKITVAHLYLAIPRGATSQDSLRVQQKIDSIYQLLANGANWDSLVKKFSDDKGSAAKGGALPEFGVNRMVPEFIEAIFPLSKPGDFTKPVLTPYGWHIITLENKKLPGDMDQVKAELKQKVTKDARSQISRDVVIKNIIHQYGLKENPKALEDFYSVVTDSIFFGRWKAEQANGLNDELFTIGKKVYSQNDFTNYLVAKQKKGDKQAIPAYVTKMYKDFLNEKLILTENENLENKYPEFKALMNEYRDGILLFDLTDQKVWSKAVKDTTGLKEFHEKNKTAYMWEARIDATIYTVKDPAVVEKVRNFLSTGISDEDLLKEVNSDSLQLLTVESGKFSVKENAVVEKVKWVVGLSPDMKINNGIVFVNIKEILKPQPKQLDEARGLITADYQNFLEKEWIKDLKRKYPVVINKEVLVKIK